MRGLSGRPVGRTTPSRPRFRSTVAKTGLVAHVLCLGQDFFECSESAVKKRNYPLPRLCLGREVALIVVGFVGIVIGADTAPDVQDALKKGNVLPSEADHLSAA